MKTKHLITTLTIAALTLVGCGNNNDEPQNAEEAQQEYADMLDNGEAQGPPAMPAGEYEVVSSTGAHIVMDIPADPGHEALTEIEDYRETTGAEPVTYLIADVDNRNGTDSVNMWKVEVFDEEGNSYEFNGVSEYVSDIGPETDWASEDESYTLIDGTEISKDEYFDLNSISTDLHNEHLHGASTAERKTMILVYEGTDLPDEYTRVAVYPNGATEEVDAYPADWNN